MSREALSLWEEVSEHPDLIWCSRLDSTYWVEVQRTGPGRAVLCIFTEEGNCLLEQTVSLAYDAAFGPDLDDINKWCSITCDFVDRLEENE